MKKKIPVLSVHDELLCREKDEELVTKQLIKSYCKDTLDKFEEFENINMAEDIIKSIKTELIIKNIKEMV